MGKGKGALNICCRGFCQVEIMFRNRWYSQEIAKEALRSCSTEITCEKQNFIVARDYSA